MDDAGKTRAQLVDELNALRRQLAEVRKAEADRLRMEEALRDSERRYRELADSLPETVFETDITGRLTFVNQAAYDHFGYTPEDFERGVNILDIVAPRDRERATEVVGRLLAGGPSEPHEYTVVRKDGSPFPAVVCSSRIMQGGRPIGLRGFLVDVTKHQQLEEQLFRAQRLETAGRIAGQVAHDFNNLLGPLVGYPDLIKGQLPEDHPAQQLCELMQAAAQQMADINEDMMALGRRGVFEVEPTDLNRVVERVVEGIVDIPDSLIVDLDLAPDLKSVSGSPAQLQRVAHNLISNAREAMGDAGCLVVRTENICLGKSREGAGLPEAGCRVRLSVTDTGHGVEPEIKDRIFDAFFTTKRTGKRLGSGLGLSIVHSIVEDHRGSISLESAVGKGTTFNIDLPACGDRPAESRTEELQGGTESILVVDDDQLQRDVAEGLLQSLGYQVDAVPSGERAVAHLEDHPADLLILDMVMPGGMDGAETYRRILEVRPRQKAIVVSGFLASVRALEARALGVRTYLRKPLTLERLARAVRGELDR